MAQVDQSFKGVAWAESGQGQAIVFLHGMPGSATSWVPQFQAFAESHRVIAWDMPGYGRSDQRPEASSPSLMAAVLSDTMRNGMNLKTAHVVGLSLGGMIAMELAIVDPSLVSSLVVMDASPKFGFAGPSDAEGFIASVREPLEAGKHLADLCREILLDLVGPSCPEAAFDSALAAMARATPDGLVHAARLISNHNVQEKLAAITAPTLVMAGVHDTATPLAYSQAIAARIAGAKLIAVPNSGHLAAIENAGFVNAQITAFIDAVYLQ
jgi:3-oxoadipate enol-lactonase